MHVLLSGFSRSLVPGPSSSFPRPTWTRSTKSSRYCYSWIIIRDRLCLLAVSRRVVSRHSRRLTTTFGDESAFVYAKFIRPRGRIDRSVLRISACIGACKTSFLRHRVERRMERASIVPSSCDSWILYSLPLGISTNAEFRHSRPRLSQSASSFLVSSSRNGSLSFVAPLSRCRSASTKATFP